ncbi:hypothetical protein D3C73_1455870 [compost metagenome]
MEGLLDDIGSFLGNILHANRSFIDGSRNLIYRNGNTGHGLVQMIGGFLELAHKLIDRGGIIIILLADFG